MNVIKRFFGKRRRAGCEHERIAKAVSEVASLADRLELSDTEFAVALGTLMQLVYEGTGVVAVPECVIDGAEEIIKEGEES